MVADEESSWRWNPQHSAFYTHQSGGYGWDGCSGRLSGYDFKSNRQFPDFYEILGIESEFYTDGIPLGGRERDNFYIFPLGWNRDGSRLWLTLRRLQWPADSNSSNYTGLPQQAGAIDLTPDGPVYTVLASDQELDYSFDGQPDPEVISKPYERPTCP